MLVVVSPAKNLDFEHKFRLNIENTNSWPTFKRAKIALKISNFNIKMPPAVAHFARYAREKMFRKNCWRKILKPKGFPAKKFFKKTNKPFSISRFFP